MWTEDFRPTEYGQALLCDRLPPSLLRNTRVHLACYGPPGTGKTTAIMAFARELSGCPPHCKAEDGYADRIMRLNGSEERTTLLVSRLLEGFVRRSPLPDGRRRVVFIDELDGMPKHTQHLLVAFMEHAPASTCFAFAFNEPSAVIEQVTSRCVMIMFNPFDDAAQISILESILEKSGTREGFSTGAVTRIVRHARGDARAAINLAQLVAFGRADVTTPACAEDVDRLADAREDARVVQLFNNWDAEAALRFFVDQYRECQSPDLLLSWIERACLTQPEVIRMSLLRIAMDVEERCASGKASELQFAYFVAKADRVLGSRSVRLDKA
jgi:DNA polymerase III delta prime subunit